MIVNLGNCLHMCRQSKNHYVEKQKNKKTKIKAADKENQLYQDVSNFIENSCQQVARTAHKEMVE